MNLSTPAFHVGRSTGTCAATGRPLASGEACMATLCERPEDAGLDRLDFSDDAWQSGARPERLFSFWRTRVPDPKAGRNLLVDDAVLIDVFERLAGDARPLRVAFRFVLALILVRKRLLKYVGRAGTGADERWLLVPRGAAPGSAPWEVSNPQLGDDDVRQITDQLSEILQSEL